ncbi:MAG: class I SAM-dependent methyltransferase [Verrucomicrobia bacterium]|nr:class I SAM-dependent methyltransferase [Verrucomicrobiota bacterium]
MAVLDLSAGEDDWAPSPLAVVVWGALPWVGTELAQPHRKRRPRPKNNRFIAMEIGDQLGERQQKQSEPIFRVRIAVIAISPVYQVMPHERLLSADLLAAPGEDRGLMERFLGQFRQYRRLERGYQQLLREVHHLRLVNGTDERPFPDAHLLTPVASRQEIAAAFDRPRDASPFSGMQLNEPAQLALLTEFLSTYRELPFPEEPTAGARFYLRNPSYGHFDATMLYSMIRHARPRRIIEVGSGFSSAAMLDINQAHFGGGMQLTFVDPDMSRLRALLQPGEASVFRLIEQPVQQVPLEEFRRLGANDILFIDSSHVAKIGSDVNRLIFDVLPGLQPGVLVHIHDITDNFEYPRDWYDRGRSWNELYLVRAFLMYNSAFRIELYTAWLRQRHHAWFQKHMPVCCQGGGGQIWLRKLV